MKAKSGADLWIAKDSAGALVYSNDSSVASRLYYEAHVTIPPLQPEQVPEIDAICTELGFRRSTFEMHKDGLVPNAFVSARHAQRDGITKMVYGMVQRLEGMGYTVLRYKIEDTLLDSSRGDKLVVLPARV